MCMIEISGTGSNEISWFPHSPVFGVDLDMSELAEVLKIVVSNLLVNLFLKPSNIRYWF